MEEILCPYTANCMIYFLCIWVLILVKAREEKALGNPFWPGTPEKWLPQGSCLTTRALVQQNPTALPQRGWARA